MNRFSNAMRFHFRIKNAIFKEETVSKVVEGHLSLSRLGDSGLGFAVLI